MPALSLVKPSNQLFIYNKQIILEQKLKSIIVMWRLKDSNNIELM